LNGKKFSQLFLDIIKSKGYGGKVNSEQWLKQVHWTSQPAVRACAGGALPDRLAGCTWCLHSQLGVAVAQWQSLRIRASPAVLDGRSGMALVVC